MTKHLQKINKTWAIISYFTFIGLIIAIIINIEKRNPFTSFHIRQMLGLILMLLVSNIFEAYINSIIGTALWFITFGCWVYGLISAIQGQAKPIPFFGNKFQDWFKNLS